MLLLLLLLLIKIKFSLTPRYHPMNEPPSSCLDVFAELAAAACELPEEDTFDVSSTCTTESIIPVSECSTEDSTLCKHNNVDNDKENPQPPSSTRRKVHNVCEKRRRESIRDAFNALQQRVCSTPKSPIHRLSKMEVLQRAVNRIESLKHEVAELEAETSRKNMIKYH